MSDYDKSNIMQTDPNKDKQFKKKKSRTWIEAAKIVSSPFRQNLDFYLIDFHHFTFCYDLLIVHIQYN